MRVPRPATSVTSPRRALATVVLVVFVDLLGFGIVIPILPFYVRSFGVSDVFIGLLAASYSLMQFGFAPLLGRLSDERGRRPVLMLSLAGSAVAWTVFGLAGEVGALLGVTGGVATLFFSRMVAGAMGGNIATAQAYVADVTPRERRAGALGLVGASFALGFIFGPALGGVLASDAVVAGARRVFPAFVPATRFSLPSFGAASLSLLSLLLAALFLAEPERTRRAGGETLLGQFRTALSDPDLRGLVAAFFLVSLAFSGVQVMFIPFVADVYGYDASQAAALLTYVGVLGVLNQGVLVGRLSRRYGDRPLALVGAGVLAVALAGLPLAPALGRRAFGALAVPLAPEVVALLVVLALLSFGNSLLNVSLATLVSAGASDDAQGSAFGVTQGAGSLGRTVGPPAMALLYAAVAVWAPFALGALLVVPILALLGWAAGRPAATPVD
ncbi:MFS transporter [Halomarina ordinaria]|uniref:MFS transporter n=1 Tax=Halomarina ordinaria TaxID=3033939 RepID=A0ABD5UGL2_9EURY|nr:MFS transporter [Halomarina sp. PSRA2]